LLVKGKAVFGADRNLHDESKVARIDRRR
jgi:hypothetical protein